MAASNAKTNLIVNYLPQSMTEMELTNLFRRYGEIQSVRIVKDHKTGYSFGYGFVNFTSEEGAMSAINAVNGMTVSSKRLKVSFARPPGEALKDTNLYVTNLPRTFTENDLDELFGQFGYIVQRKMLNDRITGMPRGVAFVRFDNKDEAEAAISTIGGQILEGGTEPVQIKIAEEHGKQKAAYYAGMNLGLRMRGVGGPNFGGRGQQINRQFQKRFNPMGSAPRPQYPPANTYY